MEFLRLGVNQDRRVVPTYEANPTKNVCQSQNSSQNSLRKRMSPQRFSCQSKVSVDDVKDQKLVEVEFGVHCDFGSEGILFRKQK